jgi:ferredoxin-type protein NapG
MCTDIPCVPVCPSGALDEASVSSYVNQKRSLDAAKMRMGLAVVDENSCIATWGIQCDACYRACPLLGEAITIETTQNERTGKHAFLKPVVHVDHCTGCGLCEHACVTQKAAIYVLPRALAMGQVGDHYIKGWDKADEKRLEKAHSQTTKTKISEKSALDSLNDVEGL